MSSFRSRRPRTCIISTMTPIGLEEADKIYRVSQHGADEVDFHAAKSTLVQDVALSRSEESWGGCGVNR